MKFGCSAAICLRAPSALRDCQFAPFAESRFTPIITSDTLQGDQQVDLQMNWSAVGVLSAFWETWSAVGVLSAYVSHSVHPRCKLMLFLSLRCCSRKMCLMFSSTFLIGRINLLAAHNVSGVRQWAKHVINAGWIHQLLPVAAAQRQDLRLLRLRVGSQGIPRGMKQEYFDSCCRSN